jgi:mRNA interferase RelE/StbE
LYEALSGLAIDPFPKGYEELKGSPGDYRIRVGHMRILYTVEESIITVIVFSIGYRGDVYNR